MVKSLPAMQEAWFYPWVKMGQGNGSPLQYSCLEKPMNREAWQATVHGVTKSWAPLSNFTFFFFFKKEKKMQQSIQQKSALIIKEIKTFWGNPIKKKNKKFPKAA